VLSLVVPCYNVGRYIDDFLQSLIRQTIGFDSVEVVLVDDGSTDDTGARAMSWADRHPGSIAYVRQQNAGLAAARNAGLSRARGEWISFPDPDDLLAPDYLEKVIGNITRFGPHETAIVACKIIHFYETTGETADDHVLTYRFAKGPTAQRIGEMTFIQLQVATAFFKRRSIIDWELWFDPKIRPGFEDAHFTNRYLVRCPQDQVAVFAADSVYAYRKRASGDSLQDTATSTPEFWTSQPTDGWLDLLRDSKRHLGHVPGYVARTVLYNIKGHLRILLDPLQSDTVAPDLQAAFAKTLEAVVSYLGAEAIRNGAPGFRHRFQLGLLNRYALGAMTHGVVYVIDWRPNSQMARVEWFAPSDRVEISAIVNGKASPWIDAQRAEHRLFGATFYYSHEAWVHVTGQLAIIDTAGKAVRLRGPKNAKHPRAISIADLERWTPPGRDKGRILAAEAD